MNGPTDLTDDIRDYSYEIPPELIAQHPAASREDARLLLIRKNPQTGSPRFEDLKVSDLPALVESEPELRHSLWLRNRSRVFKARLYARRKTGSLHEIVFLEEKKPGLWSALIRNQAKLRYPETLTCTGAWPAEIIVNGPGEVDLTGIDVEALFEKNGEMPLPPYIERRDTVRDMERYQSIWADKARALSAAAPTASLHFTPELVQRVCSKGILFADIYLHVGLGTFEPMRQNLLSQHEIHAERLEVSQETVTLLESFLSRPIEKRSSLLCVGTTALRALESLSLLGEEARKEAWLEKASDGGFKGLTQLFIKPGFEFRYAQALLTNFHLPESTLFVLVSTFLASRLLAQEAYAYAVAKRYRFYSYGDTSLIV